MTVGQWSSIHETIVDQMIDKWQFRLVA